MGPLLYDFNQQFEGHFLNPALVQAVRNKDLNLLETLLHPTHAPNVYTIQLFQPAFAAKMLEELDHHEKSRIPMRRPNGMNRYGAVLADLGFEGMIKELASQYLTCMEQHLFPKYAGPQDLTHHYAFTVRYRPGEDSMLMEHADASVVTVNVCLEPSNHSQVLYFKEHRTLQPKKAPNGTDRVDVAPTFVHLSTPGEAVVHLGQIVHGVNQVHDTRSNMVLWLFGEHGSVRVAEYEPMEALRHELISRLSWEQDESASSLQTTENRNMEEL